MTLLSDAASGPVVGFDAGWRADFRADGVAGLAAPPVVSVGRSDYDAELRINTDASFRAPTFQLSVSGMTDRDYETITSGPCPHVTLAVGWRDIPNAFVAGLTSALGSFGVGSSADGLPEVLLGRVTRTERSAGDVRYLTSFFGVGADFARLNTTISSNILVPAGSPLMAYVTTLCAQAEPPVSVIAEGDQPGIDGRLDVPPGYPLAMVIRTLEEAARGGPDQAPAPLFFSRGALHIGAWEGPIEGGSTHELGASTGLVDVVPVPATTAAPQGGNPYAQTVADAFTVTLLGRPDIHVGDVVEMSMPSVVPSTPVVGAALGALGNLVTSTVALPADLPMPRRPFRVIGVSHRIGASVGFTTTLNVVRRQPPATDAGDHSSGPREHELAEAMDARARELLTARRPMDVGIVNRQSTSLELDGAMRIPPQRLQIRSGLAPAPAPNVPVRADLLDPPTQLVDKPYLTPFAFGNTGLVLPHYPGTRVVHLNHGNDLRNAMVAGCLWADGDEPESQPGDWWLTLPTGVTAPESSEDPDEHPTGAVSSDLIDGRGVRQVGVRALHVDVGEELMPQMGERPPEEAVDELVVRSSKGSATIRFDADGNIEISTSAEIRFTARKVIFDVEESVDVQ